MKPNRRFRAWTDSKEPWIILEEQTAYLPSGYQRRRWDTKRVSITREELAALAAQYPVEKGEVGR